MVGSVGSLVGSAGSCADGEGGRRGAGVCGALDGRGAHACCHPEQWRHSGGGCRCAGSRWRLGMHPYPPACLLQPPPPGSNVQLAKHTRLQQVIGDMDAGRRAVPLAQQQLAATVQRRRRWRRRRGRRLAAKQEVAATEAEPGAPAPHPTATKNKKRGKKPHRCVHHMRPQ